jgi:hypothetical protein
LIFWGVDLFGNAEKPFRVVPDLNGRSTMITFNEMKIQEICESDHLSRGEKIEMLHEIETEAEALERAASESPMNAHDGWDADLRLVRKCLDRLEKEEAGQAAYH